MTNKIASKFYLNCEEGKWPHSVSLSCVLLSILPTVSCIHCICAIHCYLRLTFISLYRLQWVFLYIPFLFILLCDSLLHKFGHNESSHWRQILNISWIFKVPLLFWVEMKHIQTKTVLLLKSKWLQKRKLRLKE